MSPSLAQRRRTSHSLQIAASGGGERAARIITNSPFYSPSGPPPIYIAYVGIWLIVVLVVAAVSFSRREI